MNFAIDLPNYGPFSSPGLLIDLARQAEDSGWDGFFLWDHILRREGLNIPIVDTWTALAGVAAHTSRICLGPMVTPLARRRPWKVARETVSLDHLSQGRLVLGVGLGSRSQLEFAAFGDAGDPRLRAEMLDEGLEILVGLWSGEPFRFAGAHYHIEETRFLPRPLQSPRPPLWVAGTWPHKRPFRRAARWDGAFPLKAGSAPLEMLSPVEVRQVVEYIHQQRGGLEAYDIVHLGITPGEDPDQDAEIVDPYAQAGVTWWLENLDLRRGTVEQFQERIRRGPPRI